MDKEYHKKYYQKHKEQLKAYGIQYKKEWRKKNAERNSEYNRNFQKTNREYFNNYKRSKATELWLKLVALLGGKCMRCGDSGIQHLQLHHKNGNGKKERARFRNDGYTLRKYYLEHEDEAKQIFELLCANCHADLHYFQHVDAMVSRGM